MRVSKTAFYILSFTWGLPLTVCGLAAALVMVLTGHRPKRWKWCLYFETGKSMWGGCELGLFFLRDKGRDTYLNDHEFGHAVQNCFYGPVMIVLVCMPSAVRYHWRHLRSKRGKPEKRGYYDIWFERQASYLGMKHG